MTQEPTPEQVYARNAVDRDQAAAKLADALNAAMRAAVAGSKLVQHQGCSGWLRHWWRIEDERTGIAVASGRALTEWGARRRKHRAYLRALNPRAAVETSRDANRWKPWVN